MTKTFDDSLPTDKDKLRAALGETNVDVCYLSDEIIAAVLAQNDNNLLKSGIALCDMLVAYYASSVDTRNGKLSVGASKRADSYRKLRADLQRRPSLLAPSGTGASIGRIVVGGSSIAERNRITANTDNVRPLFDEILHQDDINRPRDEVLDDTIDPNEAF